MLRASFRIKEAVQSKASGLHIRRCLDAREMVEMIVKWKQITPRLLVGSLVVSLLLGIPNRAVASPTVVTKNGKEITVTDDQRSHPALERARTGVVKEKDQTQTDPVEQASVKFNFVPIQAERGSTCPGYPCPTENHDE